MIEVKHLTKRYGGHTAVSDLSFTIEPGQIYGFLGPNGAGKSTTMNIITGCLAATEGSVTIDGHDIYAEPLEAKRCIGYLPEQPPLFGDMTPYEYLCFVAEAKGVSDDLIDRQVKEAMQVTDILSVKDRLIRNLSKGYRQRVGIARALAAEGIIEAAHQCAGLIHLFQHSQEVLGLLGGHLTVKVEDAQGIHAKGGHQPGPLSPYQHRPMDPYQLFTEPVAVSHGDGSHSGVPLQKYLSAVTQGRAGLESTKAGDPGAPGGRLTHPSGGLSGVVHV